MQADAELAGTPLILGRVASAAVGAAGVLLEPWPVL